jgi:hypothetical protein
MASTLEFFGKIRLLLHDFESTLSRGELIFSEVKNGVVSGVSAKNMF